MKRSGQVYIVAGVVLAILAGALLFLYLTNLINNQAAQTPPPTPVPNVDVVVAASDVKAGTILTGEMVKRESRKATDITPAALRQVSEAVDRMAVADVKAGTVLQRGDLQTVPFVLPKGKKAMALFVDDQSSVAGLVRERDYIDILVNSSINLKQPTGTPGAGQAQAQPAPPEGQSGSAIQPTDQQVAVKAVLQRVQVLKVVAPAAQAERQQQQQQQQSQPLPQGTPAPVATATAQAQAEEKAQQGRITNQQAIIVLAVTDQEAELLRYAKEAGGFQIVLRGHEDEAVEETKGMTLDILIRDYGLPVPKPVIVDLRPE